LYLTYYYYYYYYYYFRKHTNLLEEIAKWDAKYEGNKIIIIVIIIIIIIAIIDVTEMDNEINLVTTQRIALLENLSILQTRRGKAIILILILILISNNTNAHANRRRASRRKCQKRSS